MNKGIVLRDAALKLEGIDLSLALSVMSMASEYRPHGVFIKNKIKEYKDLIAAEEKRFDVVKEKVASGKLAVIPIGFRCYTKIFLRNECGIIQASLPFDSGFFTPHAVANIFRNGEIHLKYGHDQNHSICTKNESYRDDQGKLYIKFERSTYEAIDDLVLKSETPDSSNFLLDSTCGYYTLDEKNKFILAHYNWHQLSNTGQNKGNTCPSVNIPLINGIMNKRIERMLSLCDAAEKILFIYFNGQDYDGMFIDELKYDLNSFDELKSVLLSKYGSKFEIIACNDSLSLKQVLSTYT